MKEKSKDSSRPCRAWLLQSVGDYNSVVPGFLGALRGTGYFNRFYVATDYDRPLGGVIRIPLKRDYGWSDNIINALACVREKTFFVGCEDHLLTGFDEELVELAYKAVENGEYGCVRLSWKSRIPLLGDMRISAIDKSYKYLVSLQPTAWNKDYLESVLRSGETAWQFEILASQRAKKLDIPVGVTYKTAFKYRNLIKKGKLVEDPKTYTEIHGT